MEDEDILDDPTRPSLTRYAEDGHAFAIPWSHQPRTILQGLESGRLKHPEGPWLLESPFDQEHIALSTILYDIDGNLSSYRDAYSTQSSSKTEHLSVSGGVTIGYPCLNASVHVDYDKCVVRNENGVQASRQSTCRIGRIVPVASPPFSKAAKELLHRPGGQVDFRKKYGDYYIQGFELGADASACMTGLTTSENISHSLAVTVAVKVLFFTASYTHTEEWKTAEFQQTFECAGFNTLKNASQHMKCVDSDDEQLRRLHGLIQSYMKMTGALEDEVLKIVKKLGLKNGQNLPLAACPDICDAGIVVQLLLAPYVRLEEYLRVTPR